MTLFLPPLLPIEIIDMRDLVAFHHFKSVVYFQMDTGKSPLAMLAKTCETIGLPDTPNKKEKKDVGFSVL